MPESKSQERGAGKLGWRRQYDDVFRADATYDRRTELLVSTAKQEALRADRAEHELALVVAREQIKDLPLIEVLAHDLPMGNGVDAEQRLVDIEHTADRLHGAAGTEQEQCLGPRFDLLAQMRRDVLLNCVLVGAGYDCLGSLHISRLEWRQRRHVKTHGPFVAPIFLLVEVDNLGIGKTNFPREIAHKDFPRTCGRDAEYAGYILTPEGMPRIGVASPVTLQMSRAVPSPPQNSTRSTPTQRNFCTAARVSWAEGSAGAVCTTSIVAKPDAFSTSLPMAPEAVNQLMEATPGVQLSKLLSTRSASSARAVAMGSAPSRIAADREDCCRKRSGASIAVNIRTARRERPSRVASVRQDPNSVVPDACFDLFSNKAISLRAFPAGYEVGGSSAVSPERGFLALMIISTVASGPMLSQLLIENNSKGRHSKERCDV